LKNTSINELNALLKGEHMAIHGYEKYMESIKEPAIKEELQKIQIDHKQHAIRLAERIQNLGGHPSRDVGVAGEIGQIMSTIKQLGRKNTENILRDAYNGENNGIKMAEELVKGDLDEQSGALVNDILNTDKNHLSTLSELLKS
jgi:rubrerythrin